MAIILGIDPGSRITGFGVVSFDNSRLRYLAGGSIKTSQVNLPSQLNDIFLNLSDIVEKFRPTLAAIEQVFVKINVNSALKLGQARGAALVALAKHNIPLEEYAPRQIKKAVVGYGDADKNQVQRMVKALLSLKEIPAPDEADALAVAICGAHCSQSKTWESVNDY